MNVDQSKLIDAARNGREESLRLLLDAGVGVNVVDHYGWTALMWAAYYGHDACLAILLDRGADVNVAANYGQTALMRAAQEGHDACTTILLDRGADINVADNYDGKTALMFAAYYGHDACLAILLDRGADVNLQSNNGTTAMMWSTVIGRDTIITELVKAGDRSWQHVPTPCKGLEKAFRSVYTTAPHELPELFRRLEPGVQDVVRNTLLVLHSLVYEEALRMDIVARVLET